MNTIMHIAYHAKPSRRTPASTIPKEDNIRLLYTVDNNELRLLNGITRKMRVVHSSDHMDKFLESQKRVQDAVRIYEARIYKQIPPPDIA